MTSPSSTANPQKRSAVQQRALSSGQRGVWGLLAAVQGKKMIGKDKHGNTYWEVSNPGQNPNPKREIDYFEKRMVRSLPSAASCKVLGVVGLVCASAANVLFVLQHVRQY